MTDNDALRLAQLSWTICWIGTAVIAFVVGLVPLLIVRRLFHPAVAVDSKSAAEKVDIENPYGSSSSFVAATSKVWPTLRAHCSRLKQITDITWTVALGAILMAFLVRPERLVVAFDDVEPTFWQCFILLLVHGPCWMVFLCMLVYNTMFRATWERPNLRKILSFARWAVLSRGVPQEQIKDDCFVGVSESFHGRRIGNSSDAVGFLHLTDSDCVLHLHDKEIVIPRSHLRTLTRVKPQRDTLGWIGTRVIGVSWASDSEPEPGTLFLIVWGGETPFAIKRSTDQLFERLSAWKQNEQSSHLESQKGPTHGTSSPAAG